MKRVENDILCVWRWAKHGRSEEWCFFTACPHGLSSVMSVLEEFVLNRCNQGGPGHLLHWRLGVEGTISAQLLGIGARELMRQEWLSSILSPLQSNVPPTLWSLQVSSCPVRWGQVWSLPKKV